MEEMKDESAVAANTEKMNRCKNLGNSLGILFWLKLAILFMSALMIIITLTAGFTLSLGNSDFFIGSSYVLLVANIVNFVISISASVIIITMGKHISDFTLAGIFYILYASVDLISKIFIKNNMIISIISSVFSILYTLKFTGGMINAVYPIDLDLTDGWEKLRKVYISIYGGLAISLIMTKLLSSLAIFAAIVALVAAIAAIVAVIWEVILIRKSFNEMKAYQGS